MHDARALACLALSLLLAFPSALAGDKGQDDACRADCWRELKLNLKDCRNEFPEVGDPLRQSCGSAATHGHRTCLESCKETVEQLFGGHIAFVPSSPGGSLRHDLLIRNPRGKQGYRVTVLNGDGEEGRIGHLRVLLDRRVIYDNPDFAGLTAAEIPVLLERGPYVLSFESETPVDGTVTVFVTDRRVAAPEDLGA